MSPSKGEHLKLCVGDLIDNRFEVVEEVGCGNFSKVYYCLTASRHSNGNVCGKRQAVAVKVVKKEYKNDAYFEQEMLQILGHKKTACRGSVCQMIEFFEWKGYPVFVMKIYGASLRERRLGYGSGIVTRDKVLQVARSLLETCRFIHIDCRMVHTDLKPENILLESVSTPRNSIGDNWVVCDFGSSSLWRMDRLDSDLITTRPYRAPEVVLGNPWYHPADMWSVGCIIFELAIGRRLFDVRDDLTHLQLMERCLGPLPELFKRRSRNSQTFFDHKGNFLRDSDEIILGRMSGRKLMEYFPNDAELCDFIASMLVYDPESRATAEEALKHHIFKQPAVLSTPSAPCKVPLTPVNEGNVTRKLVTSRVTANTGEKASTRAGKVKENQRGHAVVRVPVYNKIMSVSAHNRGNGGGVEATWSQTVEHPRHQIPESSHPQELPALDRPAPLRHPPSASARGSTTTDPKPIPQRATQAERASKRKTPDVSTASLQSSKLNISCEVIGSSMPPHAKEEDQKKGARDCSGDVKAGGVSEDQLSQGGDAKLSTSSPCVEVVSRVGMTSSTERQPNSACGTSSPPVVARAIEPAVSKENECSLAGQAEPPASQSLSENLDWAPPIKGTAKSTGLEGRCDERGTWAEANGEVLFTSPEGPFKRSEKSPTKGHEVCNRLSSSAPATAKGKENSITSPKESISIRLSSKSHYTTSGAVGGSRMTGGGCFPPCPPVGGEGTSPGKDATPSLSPCEDVYVAVAPHSGGLFTHLSNESVLPNITKDQWRDIPPVTKHQQGPKRQQLQQQEAKMRRSPLPSSGKPSALQRLNTVYTTAESKRLFPGGLYSQEDAGRTFNRQSTSTTTISRTKSSAFSCSITSRNSRQSSISFSSGLKNPYQLSRPQAVSAFKTRGRTSPPRHLRYGPSQRRVGGAPSGHAPASSHSSSGGSTRTPRKVAGPKEAPHGGTAEQRPMFAGAQDTRRRVISGCPTTSEEGVGSKGSGSRRYNMEEKVNSITNTIIDFIGVPSARGAPRPAMQKGVGLHVTQLPFPPTAEVYGKSK